MPTHDSIPTRGSLLERVKDPADAASWRDFCQTYGGLIARLARAAGLEEGEAEEVVQDVFIGVNRSIGGFDYDPDRCSFKHWLSRQVRWRIVDQFKKRGKNGGQRLDAPFAEALVEGTVQAEGDGVSDEFERLWSAEWGRYLIAEASRRVKEMVSPKQFQMYYLHVLNDLPVEEVIRRLKVNRGQVYLAKLRVGRLFRREVAALRAAEA